jgi:hypothetical protein
LWDKDAGNDVLQTQTIRRKKIMQAYCVKCKAQREVKNLHYARAKNGRPMAKGVCPVCSTKLNKFLSDAEASKVKIP